MHFVYVSYIRTGKKELFYLFFLRILHLLIQEGHFQSCGIKSFVLKFINDHHQQNHDDNVTQ